MIILKCNLHFTYLSDTTHLSDFLVVKTSSAGSFSIGGTVRANIRVFPQLPDGIFVFQFKFNFLVHFLTRQVF